MKQKSYCIALFLFTTIIGSQIFAQTPTENLAKYWNYKNRIKYFVNPTSNNTINNRGEGLIMSTRNVNTGELVTYGQQNVWLGYYIGVLATEYKLLIDNGQWTDAANTLTEIDRELDAVIRKDNCETLPPWNKTSNNWDGFFVRGDIFSDESYPVLPYTSSFLSTYDLNFGLTSSDNCTNLPKGNPAYISGIKELSYNADGSPHTDGNNVTLSDDDLKENDMSQDEAIGLLLGLALVKKYAPCSQMVKAAQIADKIIMKIRNNDDSGMNWIIRDPDGNIVPSYGLNDPPFFGWPFSAQFAYGFAKAGTYITGNPSSHYLTYAGEIDRRAIWNDIVQLNDVGSSNRWMGTVLGAIGNSWKTGLFFNSTVGTICRKGSYDEWYPYYLFLYAVLQDKSINFIKDKLLLCGNDFDTRATTDNNEAPCRGPYCYMFDAPGYTEDHSPDNWGSSLRFTHDLHSQNHGESVNPGVFSGVDYMLLYNLYHIVNAADLPPYTNTANRIVYETWPVWPPMWTHPVATNDYPLTVNALISITSTMTINNNLGNDPGDLGNITYRAGEIITLKPGFSVTNGATFHGYIYPFDPCSEGLKTLTNDNLLGAYDSVMMLTQPAFPAYVPTIQGKLVNSTDCGGNEIIGDTLLLVENGSPNYIHIDTILIVNYNIDDSTSLDTVLHINDYFLTNGIGIVTDSSGAFSFERTDLIDLDSTAHYKFVTKNGFPLADTTSKTVQEWIRGGSVNLTLKNVNREWIAKYNGTDSSNNHPIAIDIYGNIYVTAAVSNLGTGLDYATIKYNPLGEEQWVRIFDNQFVDRPTGIAVDTSCNVYVTGYSGTVKYDKDGNLKWAKTEDGILNAITIDKNNNVYVTGFNGTIKYDSVGNKIWQHYFNLPAENSNWAFAIETDGAGNVYLAGAVQYFTPSFIKKFLTTKLDADGNIIWRNIFAFPNGNNMDEANAMALDNQGSVYVTGNSGTVKYNAGGTLQWFAAGNNESHDAIIVDTLGNTYVSGNPLMKLSPQGNILWSNSMGGVTSGIALDAQQNIYTTGNSTAKLDPYGNILWNESFTDNQEIVIGGGWAFVVAPSNNVYVVGYSFHHDNNIFRSEVATVKYSQCHDQANNLKILIPDPTTTENTTQAKEIKVLVVPNPNNGTMQVYYNLKDPSPAFFEIYDLTGRKIFSQQLNVDSRSITISQQQLNGGVYMYMLVQNNAVVAFDKMVIIK